MHYEYIVFGSSSSLSHSSLPQYCIACATTLSSSNTQASAHPVGSMSHDAVNTSPREDWDELVLGKGLPQVANVAAEGRSWVLARFGG